MTDTADEMHPNSPRPGTGDPALDRATPDDVEAQPPGLYVDEETGPVPEPNEPA